jgi:predicted acetyltransferase
MSISLELAKPVEKSILRHFFSYYLHDLSAFSNDLQVNKEGLYEYNGLDLFFEKKGISPYFIVKKGEKIGFLLLTEPPFAPKEADYCIHELFILKNHRRTQAAEKAVMELLRQKKGTYFVVQLVRNQPAIQFWKRFYQKNHIDIMEKELEMDSDLCVSQMFTV